MCPSFTKPLTISSLAEQVEAASYLTTGKNKADAARNADQTGKGRPADESELLFGSFPLSTFQWSRWR